jgi:hypothetical protein
MPRGLETRPSSPFLSICSRRDQAFALFAGNDVRHHTECQVWYNFRHVNTLEKVPDAQIKTIIQETTGVSQIRAPLETEDQPQAEQARPIEHTEEYSDYLERYELNGEGRPRSVLQNSSDMMKNYSTCSPSRRARVTLR